MRHKKKRLKLSRSKGHSKLMIKNQSGDLLMYEYLNTTSARSRHVKSLVEKSISIAKSKGDISKRRLKSIFTNPIVVEKLIDVYAERYKDISSGFVRSVKIGRRKGDNAKMIRLIMQGYTFEGKSKKKTAKVSPKKDQSDKKKKKTSDKKKKNDGMLGKLKDLRKPKLVGGEDHLGKTDKSDISSVNQGPAKSRSGI